ncbi:MAG: hypothetical protein JST07_01965 [Bacteroidetes bacterium]|nr:hypothetical protein [Bacteroidota bacterium]
MSNKIEIEALRQIKSNYTILPNNIDTLKKTTIKHFFEDKSILAELKTDTLYKDVTKKTIKPAVTISKTLSSSIYWQMVFIVFILILYVTMVYGPIAAFLVELFPTKIRYTSMSLPYHIGNGVFGGLTPFIATLLTTIYTSDKLVGLYYPIIVSILCLVIGALYISSKMNIANKN